jgi:hypothetical protein
MIPCPRPVVGETDHEDGGGKLARAEASSSEAPDPMTLQVQMRIAAPARVLQSKTKHPIKTNVSAPDQRHQQWQMFASEESVPSQDQRADVGVKGSPDFPLKVAALV